MRGRSGQNALQGSKSGPGGADPRSGLLEQAWHFQRPRAGRLGPQSGIPEAAVTSHDRWSFSRPTSGTRYDMCWEPMRDAGLRAGLRDLLAPTAFTLKKLAAYRKKQSETRRGRSEPHPRPSPASRRGAEVVRPLRPRSLRILSRCVYRRISQGYSPKTSEVEVAGPSARHAPPRCEEVHAAVAVSGARPQAEVSCSRPSLAQRGEPGVEGALRLRHRCALPTLRANGGPRSP